MNFAVQESFSRRAGLRIVLATLKYLTCFWARIRAGRLLASSLASIYSRLCYLIYLLMTLSFSTNEPVLWVMKVFEGSML